MKEVRALNTAPDGLWFVAIGQFVWAGSVEAAEAIQKASRDGGRGRYFLHLVNTDCTVSPVDGTLSYNSQTPGIIVPFGWVLVS